MADDPIFSRLYMSVCPSVGPSVGWSVTLSLFGLLGATYGRVSGLVLVPPPRGLSSQS